VLGGAGAAKTAAHECRGPNKICHSAEGNPPPFEVAQEFFPFLLGRDAVFLARTEAVATGDERPMTVDDLFGIYRLIPHGGIDVAVPGHQLRDVRGHGCLNLPHEYVNQGRADAERSHISPRLLARMLLSRPESLTAEQQNLLDPLTAACPEVTRLPDHVRTFASFLVPTSRNAAVSDWATDVRTAKLPHLHAFVRGLERDHNGVDAALTLPFHDGGTEGVNDKTKLIKRQMYGRARFQLLRHRILLG
jgi:hypothetical protein